MKRSKTSLIQLIIEQILQTMCHKMNCSLPLLNLMEQLKVSYDIFTISHNYIKFILFNTYEKWKIQFFFYAL